MVESITLIMVAAHTIDPTVISLGSLIVAALALFISPMMAAKSAKQSMIGPMRLQWIDDVRTTISELSSDFEIISRNIVTMNDNTDFSEEHLQLVIKITRNLTVAKLLLNPYEPTHLKLLGTMTKIMNCLSKTKGREKLTDLQGELLLQTKSVLKEEWDRISK